MSESTFERRTALQSIELRAGEGTDSVILVGYAAVFNQESAELNDGYGPFRELLAPGCFTRTLRDAPDVVALKNHNTDMTLGRVGSGTLKLTQDDYGLRYELDLPDTSYARDMKISVQRKDSDFCSFGFICPAGGDSVALIGDQYYRTLRDVNLYEISLGVTFPAYSGTSVIVRSRAGHPAGFKPSTPLLDRALRRLRLLEL